jgi:hypothetical protein
VLRPDWPEHHVHFITNQAGRRFIRTRLWGSPAETLKNYWQNGDIAVDHAVNHVTHGLGCPE